MLRKISNGRRKLPKLLILCGLGFFTNMNIMAQKLYFSTPQQAVEISAKLMIAKKWGELSNYYFLENTDEETLNAMKSGAYFINSEKPEVAHPAFDWKYKKPFPPNFKYLNHIEINNDTLEVTIGVEIDQGEGMIQKGQSSFLLVKSESGYQLLP
jgi:hypothetical protein